MLAARRLLCRPPTAVYITQDQGAAPQEMYMQKQACEMLESVSVWEVATIAVILFSSKSAYSLGC